MESLWFIYISERIFNRMRCRTRRWLSSGGEWNRPPVFCLHGIRTPSKGLVPAYWMTVTLCTAVAILTGCSAIPMHIHDEEARLCISGWPARTPWPNSLVKSFVVVNLPCSNRHASPEGIYCCENISATCSELLSLLKAIHKHFTWYFKNVSPCEL